MFRGKKYQEIAKQIDKTALYDPKEGLEFICKTASAKFDETVEISVRLGVDPRHADQQVRGAQTDVHFDRFVELRLAGLDRQVDRVGHIVLSAAVDELRALDIFLTMFHRLFLHCGEIGT